MTGHAAPVAVGLRLRLLLTLAALALFLVAGAAYVVVHDEISRVDRSLAFERHDLELAAHARLMNRLDRREVAVVAAASSLHLRRAELRAFARRHRVVLDVRGHRYGRPLSDALTARVALVRGGSRVGTMVVQVARGPAVRLPAGVRARRIGAAYRRVEEAGLLALAALLVLSFLLARPLLRALRWTEERAGEARVDALTGIANRRALEETLATEIERARRFSHPLAVVLLDLDHFKRTNDEHGHAAGDELLRAVAHVLATSARRGDTVARFGGEEFVAVLPETNLAGAHQLAERLRLETAARPVGILRTTTSCGVAVLQQDDTVETLLAAADEALYRAKSRGRNRTELARRTAGPAAA